MTPANLTGMCILAGLDVVALTDHNTCGNCRSFLTAAQGRGLVAIPGMELTTAEEIHILCLFPDINKAEAFSVYVHACLPPIPNRPAVFGPQILMGPGDEKWGEELTLLASASSIGVYEVCPLVERFGGVCFPAHIDRPSYSLLSQLGLWDPGLPFPLAEVSAHCPTDFFKRPDLNGVPLITDSDAHFLAGIPDARQVMEVPERTPQAVLDWLRRGGS